MADPGFPRPGGATLEFGAKTYYLKGNWTGGVPSALLWIQQCTGYNNLQDTDVAAGLVGAATTGGGGLKSSGPFGGRPRFFGNFMISRCEAAVVTGGACCSGMLSLTDPVTNCRPDTMQMQYFELN